MPSWNLICLAVVLNAGAAFSQITSSVTLTVPSSASVPTTVTVEPTSSVPTTVLSTTTVAPPSTVVPTTSSPTISSPPTSTPVPSFQIHPNGNAAKCLDVRGALFENGTPVEIFDCNGTPAQDWVIAPGEGHVNLASTGFCLDAGSSPANGVGMKIWDCFDNLPAQDWFYTDDQRIALTNQGFCLDLTNGDLTNGNQVQTWKCTDFNANQIWTVSNTASAPGSS